MQQKRKASRASIFWIVLALLALAGAIWLVTTDIPAMQRTITQELDAGSFLEQKKP